MSGTARSGPTGADVHEALEAARRFHEAGKWDEARGIYDQILSYLPDQPDACHLRGLIALRDEELGAAEALIGRAVAADPQVADYHGNLGIALRRQGRLGDAEASYRRALAIDSGHAEAHANLGIVVYQSGSEDDAMAHFTRSLHHRPDYPLALCCAGSLAFERGEFAIAQSRLRRAAALDKNYAFGNAWFVNQDYGARTDLSSLGALWAAAPPIEGEFPHPAGAGLVVMTSCDPVYFHRYAQALALSLEQNAPGNAIHIHVYNPDRSCLDSIASLGRRLALTAVTVTHEKTPDATPAYFANVRFARLQQLVAACGREVLALDADSLIRAPIDRLRSDLGDCDIALPARPENVQVQLKILSSAVFVRPTAPARRFLERLSCYTLSCLRDGLLSWFFDQLAIYTVLRKTAFADESLDFQAIESDLAGLGENATIWLAKGNTKSNGPFRRASAEVLRQAGLE